MWLLCFSQLFEGQLRRGRSQDQSKRTPSAVFSRSRGTPRPIRIHACGKRTGDGL